MGWLVRSFASYIGLVSCLIGWCDGNDGNVSKEVASKRIGFNQQNGKSCHAHQQTLVLEKVELNILRAL